MVWFGTSSSDRGREAAAGGGRVVSPNSTLTCTLPATSREQHGDRGNHATIKMPAVRPRATGVVSGITLPVVPAAARRQCVACLQRSSIALRRFHPGESCVSTAALVPGTCDLYAPVFREHIFRHFPFSSQQGAMGGCAGARAA